MLFSLVVDTSEAVAVTAKRSEKVALLAAMLRHAAPVELPAVVAFATGVALTSRLGVGWATLSDVRPPPAAAASLSVLDVDRLLAELAKVEGAGSVARRRQVLEGLLGRATSAEQRFIGSIIRGELRQGALDGVMAAAVAKAANVSVADVQRAAMFVGSLPAAGRIALESGELGLSAVALNPSTPVQPMLASTATSVGEAIGSNPRSTRFGGVETRRGSHPGPSQSRRGTTLHPQPQRHHLQAGRRGRGGCIAATRRSGARWRGARGRCRRRPTSLSRHHGRLWLVVRSRRTWRVTAGVLLRRTARWYFDGRRAVSGATRCAERVGAGNESLAVHRHGRCRRSTAVSRCRSVRPATRV